MKVSARRAVVCLIMLACADVSMAENGAINTLPGHQIDTPTNWTFKLGANYQEFSNNNTTYGVDNNNKEFNINPSFHFGYDMGLGYHFDEKDSDLNFDYTHIYASDSSNESGSSLSLGATGSVSSFTWIEGKNDIKYDAFDVTVGHQVKLNQSFYMNYYGGFNYTHLSQDFDLTGTTSTRNYSDRFGDEFSGFGPTFGLEGRCYPFFENYPNFSVTGGIKTNALYGMRSQHRYTVDDGTRTNYSYPDESSLIPVLRADFGVNYHHQLKNQMKIDAQLGYRMTEFFSTSKGTNLNNNPADIGLQGFVAEIGLSF